MQVDYWLLFETYSGKLDQRLDDQRSPSGWSLLGGGKSPCQPCHVGCFPQLSRGDIEIREVSKHLIPTLYYIRKTSRTIPINGLTVSLH